MESLELRVSIITILEDCLRVVIPCTITGSGKLLWAILTRFCTMTVAHVDIRSHGEGDRQGVSPELEEFELM